MNNNDIKKILHDLYGLDPALRNHEKELINIIRAMAIKPEAHYDPAFAATLRAQLLAELAVNRPYKRTLAEVLASRSFRYAFLGSALVAIAIIAATSFSFKPGVSGGPVALNSSKITITNVGPNAFGTLNTLNAAATPMAAPMTANTPTAAAAMPMIPINPGNITTINYKYTGDPIAQDESQLDVLKQVAAPLSAGQATAALEQAGFGQVDLSSFSGLSMSNVTLAQNQSFGYQISLDLTDGTISIDENYNEWPQGATTTLTAADIPSDSAVITTANQFLAAHDIATTTYGTPEVLQENNIVVPLATPATAPIASGPEASNMPMIPYYSDSEQVLYPLVVNGMDVYDTSGNEIGLTVEVNVRYNRVSDVYNLDTESYQSSAYDAITNTSTIISAAETSPSYPMIYNGTNAGTENTATVVTYDLSTPTMAYAEMYQTDSNGESNEFLVPSFVFPVMNNASGTANVTPAQNIVVPLIQDFAQTDNGAARIVPYSSAASGGAAMSPTTAPVQ